MQTRRFSQFALADVHQRSSSRPSRTMFGSTLSPKIIRLRAA
jgi:hypothetical protein